MMRHVMAFKPLQAPRTLDCLQHVHRKTQDLLLPGAVILVAWPEEIL